MERALGIKSTAERYLEWKAQHVYDEFGAYSVVMDRNGVSTTYITKSQLKNEDIITRLSSPDIVEYLGRIMAGEEIALQTEGVAGASFTVGVPCIRSGVALGAVFIQTAAQTVHASFEGLAWQLTLAALLSTGVAALAVFLYTRQQTRPLTAMAAAARGMARGEFEKRAPDVGSRETRDLAAAFNLMAAQLGSLEQSRKDFVANVSHELRSPVTSIQGFAQGMLDGTIPEDEHARYLRVIDDETRRMNKLIAELLDLSRMENDAVALTMTDFDVNEATRRVIIGKMPQIDEKELDIDLDFAEESCFVHADADQITQVVTNLVDNAVKFTPPHGAITVTTRREGARVTLCVRDTGPGVLEQDAPHIFERFYKAEKAHTAGKGTGLGLAICKRIMDRHGQEIRLLPQDRGAAFEITLAAGKGE